MEISPHFKYRVAFCKYVQRFWSAMSPDYSKKLLQSYLSLCCDRVPNVRMAVATSMAAVSANNRCPNVYSP
jgi:hypothetical protein